MKRILEISFWFASILLVAGVVTSLGYRLAESVFIGTLFLPGALAVRYFYPQISFKKKVSGIRDLAFVSVGILAGEVFLFMMAHVAISGFRDGFGTIGQWPELPEILVNPLFISVMISALSVGNYYFERLLDRKIQPKVETITFTSERKAVTLELAEILYVESNDTVTTVVATGGRRFRNRTPISQWEGSLGKGFVRIHRSYVVRTAAIASFDVDTVYIADTEFPVSRKYRESLSEKVN